jgi:hypothetical protein
MHTYYVLVITAWPRLWGHTVQQGGWQEAELLFWSNGGKEERE